MSIHEAWRHNFASQIDITLWNGVAERVRFSLIDLDDEPSSRVNSDGDIADECLLLRVEKRGCVNGILSLCRHCCG